MGTPFMGTSDGDVVVCPTYTLLVNVMWWLCGAKQVEPCLLRRLSSLLRVLVALCNKAWATRRVARATRRIFEPSTASSRTP